MNNTRLDELLPFYVNGTLGSTEHAAVEQYLREHSPAAAQVQWYRSLQDHVRADVPAVSSEVGLERAMQRIRADRPARANARPAAATGWADRLRSLWSSWLPQPLLRPALAAALAVVAGQAVWIAHLSDGGDATTELRAIAPSVTDKGPYLKVNFKSDAREADIRLLLVEIGGSLASGPGQLGDWFVRVPPGSIDSAAAKLRTQTIVDAVAVVDALPARQ